MVSIQGLRQHLQSPSQAEAVEAEDAAEEVVAGALPPQKPLRGWVQRGRALASQTALLLQQLLWLLHCCPEDLQKTEAETGALGLGPPTTTTPRCLSPLADHRQPPGCLMRRGDATWVKVHGGVEALLEETRGLKTELDAVEQETSQGTLHTWWGTLLEPYTDILEPSTGSLEPEHK